MIYTHVLGLGASGVRSPLDGLEAMESYAADSAPYAAGEACRGPNLFKDRSYVRSVLLSFAGYAASPRLVYGREVAQIQV